jgi:hypothetical protein
VLNSSGTVLVYSTFLGGSVSDVGYGITVDGTGQAYVTGLTTSADYPCTVGAFDTSYSAGGDAFVSVLDPTGTALVYSSLLGGSNSDYGYGIAVDTEGLAYVAGATYSTDYPTTSGAVQGTYGGGEKDATVSVLSATGGELLYSTYLGGNYADEAAALAVPRPGSVYVTGSTASTYGFPTTAGAFRKTNSYGEAFVSLLQLQRLVFLPLILR